jgi:hypothetical protein
MLLRRLKENMGGRIKMENLHERLKNRYVLVDLVTLVRRRAE